MRDMPAAFRGTLLTSVGELQLPASSIERQLLRDYIRALSEHWQTRNASTAITLKGSRGKQVVGYIDRLQVTDQLEDGGWHQCLLHLNWDWAPGCEPDVLSQWEGELLPEYLVVYFGVIARDESQYCSGHLEVQWVAESHELFSDCTPSGLVMGSPQYPPTLELPTKYQHLVSTAA